MKVGYYGMNEGEKFEDLKIWKFEDLKMDFYVLIFRCAGVLIISESVSSAHSSH